MKLLYGTHNPSKLQSMIDMLDGLRVEIESLASLDMVLQEAPEDGNEPLDNAIQKATTYYRQIGRPVFSCDSGLYFEGVPMEDQPGVWIKRIHGNHLSYREMLEYYSELAKKYGGRLTAYYKNAVCLVLSEDEIYSYDGEELQTEKFFLVDRPHPIYREGYPLDSISVEIKSNQYYYDLEDLEADNLGIKEGFRDFFTKALGIV